MISERKNNKGGLITNFSILENKGNGIYTIYDMERKGVCCCTLDTLVDLQKAGHTVHGLFVTEEGKASVSECDVNGAVRESKAPVYCDNLITRNLSMILKGLPEAEYPMYNRHISAALDKYKPMDTFLWQSSGGNIAAYYCVLMEDGSMCFCDGRHHPASFVDRHLDSYLLTNVSDDVRFLLVNGYKLKQKEQRMEKEIADLQYQLQIVEQDRNELNDEYTHNYDQLLHLSSQLELEAQVQLWTSKVNGDEILRMGSELGNLNIAQAIAIIKKSSRPVVYSYGLKYTQSVSFNKPISADAAVKLLYSFSGLIDINFTEDLIDLSEYDDQRKI